MNTVWHLLWFGGGFILASILLTVAGSTSRTVTRYLCVIAWLAIVMQCGAWLLISTLAGGHSGEKQSFVHWFFIGVIASCVACFWSRELWKRP